MRIEYRILWIEDTRDWLEPKIEDIETYLDERGFELKCEIISKYEKRDFSQYDIIVVDYNLENEEKGSEAVKIIRNDEGIFTEILFYSISGEGKLRGEIADKGIDGVYCADRNNCIERLENLIDITIRKTQEINNLRGLFMAETSGIDNLIKKILMQSAWTEEYFEELHANINKYDNGQKKERDGCLGFDTSNLGILIYGHTTSNFCFCLLKKFISTDNWEKIKGYEEIIEKRNFLAHGTEISSSSDKIIVTRAKKNGLLETMELTPDNFIELRKKIKEFKNKFDTINNLYQ